MDALIKCLGGDFIGNLTINIGVLWLGPKADKFRGITFLTPKKKYDSSEIVKLTEMGQEQIKSFSRLLWRLVRGHFFSVESD